MSEELVDIVDENDNVIGQDTKKNAHALGKWHRVAAFLIFQEEPCKNVLIQKRSLQEQLAPGLLSIPREHLRAGETYLHGGLRGLHEEMLVGKWLPGVDITPLFRIKVEERKEFILLYRIVYAGPFKINPQEVEEYHFVELKEVYQELEAHPEKYGITVKKLFEEYKKRGYVK